MICQIYFFQLCRLQMKYYFHCRLALHYTIRLDQLSSIFFECLGRGTMDAGLQMGNFLWMVDIASSFTALYWK